MHFELHKSEALNRQRYWLSSNEITDGMICLLLWEWSISSQHGKVRGLLHGAEEEWESNQSMPFMELLLVE